MKTKENMSNKSVYFAEVIESYQAYYKAQSWDYSQIPAYGALVVAEYADIVCYGMVYQSFTGSDDAVHSIAAYQKTHDELQHEQPQIFILLKTTLNAIIIGYARASVMYYQHIPVPVPIHTFVRFATTEELALFSRTADYVPMLFSQARFLDVDNVLGAFISHLKHAQLIDENQLMAILNVVMHLSGDDYCRVRLLAHRFEQS
jgi:hypothetical protein